MANKSSNSRVSKTPDYSTISGMDREQMCNEILLKLPRNEFYMGLRPTHRHEN